MDVQGQYELPAPAFSCAYADAKCLASLSGDDPIRLKADGQWAQAMLWLRSLFFHTCAANVS
jgi:hypothetical protein